MANKPGVGWLFRMAWRDSRGQRARLLLFLSCITVGVAAMVALRSYWADVSRAIDQQSRTLVGADLVVRSRTPFPDEVTKFLDKLPGEKATELRFSTMVWFAKQEQTRLVQVRAIEGNFPFYGELKVEPADAVATMRTGKAVALVEESLLLQFGAKKGDFLTLGKGVFEIAGAVKEIPGETIAMAQLAPRILIHHGQVQETGLLGFGSRLFYRRAFKLPASVQLAPLEEDLKAMRTRNGFSYDTVATRQESLGRSLGSLFQFLNLVALTALILGGIGIGSSVHLYVRGKLASVAILRCLGASGGLAMRLYLLQAAIMGLIGGLTGSFLCGIALQQALPHMLQGMLPVQVEVGLSPAAFVIGVCMGVGVTIIFSLEPLLAVGKVTPLLVLRQDFEAQGRHGRWTRWGLRAIVVVGIGLAAAASGRKPMHGVAFAGGLLTVFFLLAALAKLLLWVLRRLAVHQLPYAIRQGLMNLYRPRNQTLLLTLAIGAGTFLIMTLHLSQAQLLSQFGRAHASGGPNVIMFDVQSDQADAVKDILAQQKLPALEEVPIVTMRLSAINGVDVETLRERNQDKPDDQRIPRWTLSREYRSTYREVLGASESVMRGEFTAKVTDPDGIIPISLERGIAEDLKVDLGDQMTFDVQGVPMRTQVTSIRKVDWYRVEPNFFVVFPAGVLEQAPQMIVIATHVKDAAASADLQKAVVQALPNVSVVDLSLVVGTLTKIFDSMTTAVDFMAALSIVTGLIVLVCSLTVTRVQRQREGILLKTLGASKKQLMGIAGTEFIVVGLLSGGSGAALAACAAWALGYFVFESTYIFAWPAIVIGVAIVTATTLIVGFASTFQLYRQSAFEALRRDN